MSEFLGVPTLVGQAKIAAAIGGTPLVITQIAVGDGNGAPITPNEAMVALVHEVWRGGIEAGAPDATDPNVYRFTTTIPEEAGPFDIREIAAFDEDGDMIAIAKHPVVEKRTPGGGAAIAVTTDMIFPVSETAEVTVVIAPTSAVSVQSMLRAPFMAVESASLTAPPAGPDEGATYVVAAGATGDWSGLDHMLVQWNGDSWSAAIAAVRTVVGVAGKEYLERTATGWRPFKLGSRFAIAGGTANAITATLDPAPQDYYDGLDAWIRVSAANTGAVTVNLNGLGNRAVRKPDGSALAAGDLPAAFVAHLVYADGGFQLSNAVQVPDATTSVKGKVELATTPEAITGTATNLVLTPATGKALVDANATPDATTAVRGKVELATVTEATTGTDTERAVTPAGLKAAVDAAATPDASATVKGKVELATEAETLAGTDTVRAVVPAHLMKAIQQNGLLYGADTSSGANTVTVTLTPAPAAYFEGMALAVKINTANTGAATMAVNGMAAKAIVSSSGAALVGGELRNGRVVVMVYDGTSFQLVSGGSVQGTPSAGYIKFDNGLILQWGSALCTPEPTGTSGEALVSFPIAFPTNVLPLVLGQEQAQVIPGAVPGGFAAYYRDLQLEGVRLGADEITDSDNAPHRVSYFAIGY